ncbi:RNA methyltransferase [Treponema brennaborense]|uniref:tRNA/rRNA methyltransferase (SpoU) n=1 Tax=Treponema brennaborense (strain DSM 12168 / CIP 105900 / DD5/3) TaxID=906968 RepID=F4LL85_TREBD|nr:RNA methyltransferase [Treponema brennaborense]AEE17659.1 tRNA/rRNA methyltransferase (SpoU) [Treponema brennaborense DSM 12168]
MDLSRICIVLAHPEESRNVGAVCRAMANSGMKKLRIVGKKQDYDDERVRILAIHAAGIWERAEFFETITQATADCPLSAGTTRRKGKKRKNMLLLPEEFARQAAAVPGAAVVFGNERTGLTDEELAECTVGVTIPSHESFASLNLSHAVQIICYTLFRAARTRSPGYTPVPLDRLDAAVGTIADDLRKIGFFSVTGRADMERFWRSILARAALSEGECRYIEKIFDKAAGLASKNGASEPADQKAELNTTC